MAELRYRIKRMNAAMEEGKNVIVKYMSLHNVSHIANDAFYVSVTEYDVQKFDAAQFRLRRKAV